MTKNAPRTGQEAMVYLRKQVTSNTTAWKGQCLKLQRTARGIPALYPSALSAAHATPKAERVVHPFDLKRGMVAYSDDPNDGNPYGHIYAIAGWDGAPKKDCTNLLTYSNDVRAGNKVGLVPITFYRRSWGDTFQFGATWLNGYNFADLDAAPAPVPGRQSLKENLEHAIHDLEKAIRTSRRLGNTQLTAALWKDLATLRVRYSSLYR